MEPAPPSHREASQPLAAPELEAEALSPGHDAVDAAEAAFDAAFEAAVGPAPAAPPSAPPPMAPPGDGPHSAPKEDLLQVVGELLRTSPRGVSLDALANRLKNLGFQRPPGSPRLVTRVRNYKELAVSPSGLITWAGAAPAGEAASGAPASASAEGNGGRRRRRRGGRGRSGGGAPPPAG